MFVYERMTKNVATITPNDTIADAFQVLKEREHSQLPVIDDEGKLIGLITEKLLAQVSPSKATTLSVFELNYLLSKTKVKDIMNTNIFKIHPDALIEDAAMVMKKNDIGSLPVVDKENYLVGIVTRLDIFSAFIDIMGVSDEGSRITLSVADKPGTMADISGIIKDFGVNITHVSNFQTSDGVEIIIKINTNNTEELVKVFKEHGYKVLSINKKQ